MTRTELLADLYRRLGYTSSPASDVTTRLTAFLDETVSELASEPGLSPYLARLTPPLVVASVASQAVYAVPSPGLDRITAVTDRTNDRRLAARSFEWYRSIEPDPVATSGTPEAWIPMGISAVAKQPSNASALFVDSTSASDTGTATALVMTSDGQLRTVSVVMTGITGVTLSSTVTTITQVLRFTLSAVAVGTVTLLEDAEGGTILATVPPGKAFSRYTTFALWPTPAAAVDYYIDGDVHLAGFSVATEEPLLPARFHHLIVEGAIWREYLKRDDTRADYYRKMYEHGVSQLRYFLTCPPDFLPSRSGRMLERSRLGAYYPADRIGQW